MSASTSAVRAALAVVVLSLWTGGCQRPPTSAKESPRADAVVTLRQPEDVAIEPIAEMKQPDVATLVKTYNARDFGSPGWRRVSLDLLNDSRVTRSFTVVNLWESSAAEVSTLFYLEQPQGLGGTSYLLNENGGVGQEIKVYLFLPAGERRVLEVAPDNLDEGLLGSDFTYNDLRMRLPVKGYRYRLAGQSALQDRPAWVVEAEPSTPEAARATKWGRARFYLAREFPFLLGADYFERAKTGGASTRINKRMRVESLEQRGATWTATRITMYGEEQHASVLALRDAHFKLEALEPRLLTPDSLPTLPSRLRRHGWIAEEVPPPKP